MSKKPETRTQNKIRQHLAREFGKDLWCFKVHGGPFQQDGIGDIVGVVFGLAFMFEVKHPKMRRGATEVQLETIGDFKRAGGIAAVIKDSQHAIALIYKAL